MKFFQSNIINMYGDRGRIWLDRLPKLTKQISSHLNLRNLEPVTNLSYNYVLSGFQGHIPIILKIGLNNQTIQQEAFALKCFAGCNTVKLLATDENNILLLEHMIPGISLKSHFPDREEEALQIAGNIMKKHMFVKIPEHHPFPYVKDWLLTLNKPLDIPSHYLQKAREVFGYLLSAAEPDLLLHGDLHHDNILKNGDDWIMIDPKGMIGELAYEIATFIRNPIPDLLIQKNFEQIIQNRIAIFANHLNIPPARIRDWCFVQAILSWMWAIGDNCDTAYFEQITHVFYKML